MRVAAIDCGTNAIRLLVSDATPQTCTDVVRRMETVRLGEGVDRTGVLSSEALHRTFVRVEEYAAIIKDLGVERLRFVATSATRDAANRADFVDGVRARLGVDPEVLTGLEEAALSFTGACDGAPDPQTPTLVVDIGGGSTEFVLGANSIVQASISVDIGCVRMTERHLPDDPPTASQIQAARAGIDSAIALAAGSVDLVAARRFIGVAGTVTTVAAMARNLPEYDADVIHGLVIARSEVQQVTAELLAMTRAERAALPFMHPGRVDVIGGGALILTAIMEAGGYEEVVVSERDILDGLVLSLCR